MNGAPYVIRPDEGGGAANVHRRDDGEWIGRVLRDFYGRWEAVAPRTGRSIARCRYRGEAVAAVWAHHLAIEEGITA